MSARAPMLNKMVISSPAPSLAQRASPSAPEQAPGSTSAQPPSLERQRVVAAMRFGEKLYDLGARARLQQEESDAASLASWSPIKFPEDLLIRRDPKALLRSACQKLLKLEPVLLGLDRPDKTSPPRPQSPPRPPTPNSLSPALSSSSSGGHPTPTRPLTERVEQTVHPSKPSSLEASSAESTVLTRPAVGQPDELAPQPELELSEIPSDPNGHSNSTSPLTPDDTAIPASSSTEKSGGPTPLAGSPASDESLAGSSATTRHSARPESTAEHSTPEKKLASVRLPASVGPSGELKIKQKVDALLRSPAQSEDDLDELDEAICEWDRRIVELVIDSPAVLSGYKVGKALSLTRWKIWAARRWSRAGWAPSLDPWEEVFCKKRVDEIQRHLNALSNFLDPRAVTAVSTGLGYWRNALLSFTSTEGPTSVRSPSWWRNTLLRLASIGEPSNSRSVSARASSQEHVIKIPAEQSEKLLKALEEQSRIWLDLLTGRRPPDSFPTAGIVTALTKKMAANLWSRLFRFLMPVVAGIAVLVVVVALVWAGYLAYRAGNSGAGSGLFGSLGTAVGGVITFLAVQGQALLGRGAANGAWGRPGNGGTRNNGAFLLRSNHGIGAAAGVLADLQRDVLSGVVEQIRLEELNLAVSEPLMRCVLALNNRESQKGDPLKDAERFLRLIYKEESNLDRLRPVFKDLYKH